MKTARNFFIGFVLIVLLINLVLIFTEKTYLYKGVANTYLKGRNAPSIDEYEIFESNVIQAQDPQEWPIHREYNRINLHSASKLKMEDYETVSYLVIKNDSILYEKYWEKYGMYTISNSFSMAKTIVSILTGIALKEGKIDSLDQRVGDFLPEFKEGFRSEITIRHLLTMSSGIDFDEHYSSPFAYPAAAYYGRNLRKLTLDYEPTVAPGEIFNYQSGTTQLLGFVLTAATGKSLSEYAEEKLWTPIGAENDALWNLDKKDGMEKAFCCFIATTRDFARLGKLYKDHGRWNGIQIVDSAYVAESISPAPLKEANGSPQNRYGFKWWIMEHEGNEIFYARGIQGQYVFVLPEKHMIVVRLGRKRENDRGVNPPKDIYVYLDAALKMEEILNDQ